ncbi:unnamed protein product, partial [Chrysoparadoxa australica]
GALVQRFLNLLPEVEENKVIVESVRGMLQHTKKLTHYTEHLRDRQTIIAACMPPGGMMEKGADQQEEKVKQSQLERALDIGPAAVKQALGRRAKV